MVKCTFCKKELRKHSMKRHVDAVHLNVKNHKCTQCDKSFASTKELNSHIKKIHAVFRETFSCDICGAALMSKVGLSSHKNHVHGTVSVDSLDKCEVCGKTFKSKSYLKEHVKVVHKKLKTKTCEKCNKTFITLGSLKIHIKMVHEKSKDTNCDLCGLEFFNMFSLKSHTKTVHKRQKDFSCEVCKKNFTGRSGRDKHLKLHEISKKQ